MTDFDTKDHYFMKAKSQGYVARSVYKLEEIDKSLGLIKRNDHVLDLGCAPGSWLQYVDKKIGKNGAALGVDLQEVNLSFKNAIHCLKANVFDLDTAFLQSISDDFGEDYSKFDVILSDMAPKTSGIKHMDQQRSLDLGQQVFSLSQSLLKPSGHMLIKLFDGEGIKGFFQEVKQNFAEVKHKRPKGIRPQSKEFYLVALNFKSS